MTQDLPETPRSSLTSQMELTPQQQLERLRGTIDNIDAALIHMLAERFRCTQEVGYLKARSNFAAADPVREKRQVARLRHLASEAHLDPDFAEKFLGFIIHEVIRHHEAIAIKGKTDNKACKNGKSY